MPDQNLPSYPDMYLPPKEYKKQKAEYLAALQNMQLPHKTIVRPRRPVNWTKPRYNTPEYNRAFLNGWITDAESRKDATAYEPRRERSLKTCWRYSPNGRDRRDPPTENKAFTPQMSTRVDRDQNLTPMARVLAHRLCEKTYRDNREGRYLLITISYLARAMHRCDRSIQRYVKELIDEGYICVDVLKSHVTKMVIGLKIRLRRPLFADHHKYKWPERSRISEATYLSDKDYLKIKILEGGKVRPDKVPVRRDGKEFLVACEDLTLIELCAVVPRYLWSIRCMSAVKLRHDRIYGPKQITFGFGKHVLLESSAAV